MRNFRWSIAVAAALAATPAFAAMHINNDDTMNQSASKGAEANAKANNPKEQIKQEPVQRKMVTGEVVSRKNVFRSISIKDKATGNVIKLSVNNDTRVLVGDTPTRLSVVQDGSEVRAAYRVEGTKMVAERIQVVPGTAPTAKENKPLFENPPGKQPAEQENVNQGVSGQGGSGEHKQMKKDQYQHQGSDQQMNAPSNNYDNNTNQ